MHAVAAVIDRRAGAIRQPVETVAGGAGYGTTAALRAQFAQRLHTSPRAYRRAFRG